MATPRTARLMILVIFLHRSVHSRSQTTFPRTSSPSESLLNSDPDVLFNELDRNEDGTIDLDEFNMLFVSSAPSTSASKTPLNSPSLSPFSSTSRSDQPSRLRSLAPLGGSSKTTNPSMQPSIDKVPSSAPFHSPASLPTASQSKQPSLPTPLRPTARPSSGPISNPTAKPSLTQNVNLSFHPSLNEPTHPVSFAPMLSPSTFTKSSASPSIDLILPVRANTNVTLVSVNGILNADAKLVFEELTLLLLHDQYPRKDCYDIEFLFVRVEGQVLNYDNERLLQEADRLGDLTVFLEIAAEVSPTTPNGFDFQLSMSSFFLEHGSALIDRIEKAGVSIRPDSVQSDTTERGKADKNGGTSIGDYFSPTVIAGISLAMMTVILLGVFITSRSLTTTALDDHTLESPTGRLGATPSYDRDDNLDLESMFMPLSKLPKQGEGQSKGRNIDIKSLSRNHSDHSTSTGSPAGSHLAGLDVLYPASFASDEEISFAVTSPQTRGPTTTASEIKRTWASSQRRVKDCGTIRALAANMFDDASTNETSGTSTEPMAPTNESRARQQKRKLEDQLYQSKQRSRGESLPLFLSADTETRDDVSRENDDQFRSDSRGEERRIQRRAKGTGQRKVRDDLPDYGSVLSDEMGIVSDMILDVDNQENEEGIEKNKHEPKASNGWFRRGKRSKYGLFSFGKKRRGNPEAVTHSTRSPLRGRNEKKKSDFSDDDGDEEPDTILLGQAVMKDDGNSPTNCAKDRNRPPRLDLRELCTDCDSKLVPNSVGDQAEPDRYTLSKRSDEREEEQPLHIVRHIKSKSLNSHKQGDDRDDPPTASEHRRTLLEILDAVSPRSEMERKRASIRRQRPRKVSFRDETITFPVNENSEIVGSIRNDGDNQVELQWGHVI